MTIIVKFCSDYASASCGDASAGEQSSASTRVAEDVAQPEHFQLLVDHAQVAICTNGSFGICDEQRCARGVPVPVGALAYGLDPLDGLPATIRGVVAAIELDLRYQRPRADVWSVIEYLCHLRDVYITCTVRLHRTRTEDCPSLEPMLNDLRARRFRYNERDVATMLEELAAVMAGFAEEASCTNAASWDRVSTRLPSEYRTARWLVRQPMHEGLHHLHDIREVGNAVDRAR